MKLRKELNYLVEIKKASLTDTYKLCTAIMELKTNRDCITQAEMQEYIDRTYYAVINGRICAIVVAIREQLSWNTTYPDHVCTTHPNRYIIKYALMDKYALDQDGSDPKKVMSRLFRELCADLSDWSVWLDIDYQAEINGWTAKEDVIDILTVAAEENSFKQSENRFSYLRVTPIDFGKLH